MKPGSDASRSWAWSVAGLHTFATGVAVWLAAVNVPFWEQWIFADEVVGDGQGWFGFVSRTYNEHRLVFPRLVLLALARTSDWDTRVEVCGNYLLALGILFLLVRLFPRVGPVLSATLVLSLSQWESWLWGWTMPIFLCIAAVLGTVLLLLRANNGALAAIFATVASFCFACGFAIFLAAGPLAWKTNGWKGRCVWAILGGLSGSVFLVPYIAGNGGATPTLDAAAKVLAFFFVYVGSAVAYFDGKMAGAVGIAGALLLGHLVRKRGSVLWSAGGALCLFVVCAGLITAVGRIEYPLGLTSRYTTVSNLFWVGLGALVLSEEVGERWRAWYKRLVVVGALSGSVFGLVPLVHESDLRQEAADALCSGTPVSAYAELFPDPSFVARQRERIYRHDLSFLDPRQCPEIPRNSD